MLRAFLNVLLAITKLAARPPALSAPQFLTPFAAPKSDRLSVLLELRDQLVALLDHVVVLLVLVIRPVRLNDTPDAVHCTRDTVRRNELREVPVIICQQNYLTETFGPA